jgi:hypothetical protein
MPLADHFPNILIGKFANPTRVQLMLRTIQRIICRAYGDKLPDVEEWALQASKLSTPDQIIASHIVASIAKDFDAWTRHNRPEHNIHAVKLNYLASRSCEDAIKAEAVDFHDINRVLENKATGMIVCYRCFGRDTDKFDSFYVDGVPLSNEDGSFIVHSHRKIGQELVRVAAAAAKALREMKENEEKWNLVEKLSGMVRNEFGALVPKESVCPPSKELTDCSNTTVARPSRQRRSPQPASLLEPITSSSLTATRRTRSSTNSTSSP